MAFDAYMMFQTATGPWLTGESQSKIDTGSESAIGTDLKTGQIFEITDFSFDIEQVLNIGSSTSGAGAGKVTFNPYQITRNTDRISPQLYQMCCSGTHFKIVSLYLRRAGTSGTVSGSVFLRFDFALVAVKTISWSGSDGDDNCKEEVTFEYGALQVRYCQQDAAGKPMAPQMGAWNRVYNNSSFDLSAGIKAS